MTSYRREVLRARLIPIVDRGLALVGAILLYTTFITGACTMLWSALRQDRHTPTNPSLTAHKHHDDTALIPHNSDSILPAHTHTMIANDGAAAIILHSCNGDAILPAHTTAMIVNSGDGCLRVLP